MIKPRQLLAYFIDENFGLDVTDEAADNGEGVRKNV